MEQQDGISNGSPAGPTRRNRSTSCRSGHYLNGRLVGRDAIAAYRSHYRACGGRYHQQAGRAGHRDKRPATLCNVSTGRPPRTRRTATGERRAAYDPETLLEVAARVFTERGYEGTSMEHLAAAAGITKSSIYHHVPGKEALLRAALDRALDALLDEELPYVTLLLRVRGNTDTEQDALERRRTFDRLVTKLVAEAAQDGDLAPEIDPGLTTRLVFGMINSITEWYHPGRGVTVHELADAVVALTLRRKQA
jgi:hypothetical protein